MTAYHSLTMNPRAMQYKKSIEAVPDMVLAEMSYKLFALMNLAWDYVDTILDLCIAGRIADTKPLVRRIRELKRDYDRFRWGVMDKRQLDEEEDNGLDIEAILKSDFTKLQYGLHSDIAKLDLTPTAYDIVLATQQALTLMDAVRIYARHCDKIIQSYDVWVCDCCMVQTEFLKLYPLIPQFAGDCYQPNLQSRRISAGIIANKLQTMELPVMARYRQCIHEKENDNGKQ